MNIDRNSNRNMHTNSHRYANWFSRVLLNEIFLPFSIFLMILVGSVGNYFFCKEDRERGSGGV